MKGKLKKSKSQQQEPSPCLVCKCKTVNSGVFEQLKCQVCEGMVHKNCYFPDFKEKDRSKFKCDPCKKRTSKNKDKQIVQNICSHCKLQSPMLKDVGNQQWMHVLCALTSSRTHLNSYLTLNFAVTSPPPTSKSIAKAKRCNYCNSDRSQAQLCRIKDCKQSIHLNCVVNWGDIPTQSEEYQSIATFGMLDLFEGSLRYRLEKKQQHFPGLTLVQSKSKEPGLIVCGEHNTDNSFVWCACKKENEGQMNQCDICKRWCHIDCLSEGMCKACRENDIFNKNLKLPQVIAHAAKVQKQTQLDKHSIKFLDHFCFKLSQLLEKNLIEKKNAFEVERYFLRQYLESYGTRKEKNEHCESQLMEILHYLLRREYKEESDITPQNIEQMLAQLSGKGSKFQWSQQKIEKIQNTFKDFIQSKLKAFKKDSIRQIRIKLASFHKQNNEPGRSLSEIASDIVNLSKILNTSETWQTIAQKDKIIKDYYNDHELIQFFAGANVSEEEIKDILKGIKKLIKVKNGIIEEKDYQKIVLQHYEGLSEEKRKELRHIHMGLLKGTKQRKVYQTRRILMENIQNNFAQSHHGEKIKARNKAINNGIFISSSSQLFSLQSLSIEVEILKRQFLKNYNSPSPHNISQALLTLANLLKIDSSTGALSKQQRKNFTQLYHKYTLYQTLIMYVQTFKQQQLMPMPMTVPVPMPYPEMSINGNTLQEAIPVQNGHKVQENAAQQPQTQSVLEEKLRQTLLEWPSSYQHQLLALSILRQSSQYNVPWSTVELSILSCFFQSVLQKLEIFTAQGLHSPKNIFYSQVKQIALQLKQEEKYDKYVQMCELYEEWKEELQEFAQIQHVLESEEKCQKLLDCIEKKMGVLDIYAVKIDLSDEVRKLKVLKTWALFSQKFIGTYKSTTITAIQNAKSLMQRIQYPKNAVRKSIQRLQQEARSLNKRINRFLQKPKITDMQFFEQLRFIQSKMTLKEASQLKKDLQGSQLDVQIQLNELKEQIAGASKLTLEPEKYNFQMKNLESLTKIRRQFLESPFMVCSVSQYELFLKRYYSLRCIDHPEPLTKKQYMRLLNNGGSAAVELLSKTQALFNVYKEIEMAQRQILSSKPRPDNLLIPDLRRYRSDLLADPAELSRVQRYFSQFNKYKHQFALLKDDRADIDRFIQLQSDLQRIPINSNDIISQINRMKKQLEDLSRQIKHYMPQNQMQNTTIQNISYESPFTTAIVARYQRIGMRCEGMNRFENLVIKFGEIADMSRNIDFDKYKPFSVICNKLAQLCNNDEFYRIRENAFERIHQMYIQSTEPLIQVGLTLLAQGGFLLKRPQNTEKYLLILMEVHKRVYKWQKPHQSGRKEPIKGESQEDKDQYDSDEFDDEVDEDPQGLENAQDYDSQADLEEDDFDEPCSELEEDVQSQEQDEEGQGQGSPKQAPKEGKSKKRARPKPIENLISDDDEEN